MFLDWTKISNFTFCFWDILHIHKVLSQSKIIQTFLKVFRTCLKLFWTSPNPFWSNPIPFWSSPKLFWPKEGSGINSYLPTISRDIFHTFNLKIDCKLRTFFMELHCDINLNANSKIIWLHWDRYTGRLVFMSVSSAVFYQIIL